MGSAIANTTRNQKHHKRPEAKISNTMFTAQGLPQIRAKADRKMSCDVWKKYERLSDLYLFVCVCITIHVCKTWVNTKGIRFARSGQLLL